MKASMNAAMCSAAASPATLSASTCRASRLSEDA
jgi:hypothetical protein